MELCPRLDANKLAELVIWLHSVVDPPSRREDISHRLLKGRRKLSDEGFIRIRKTTCWGLSTTEVAMMANRVLAGGWVNAWSGVKAGQTRVVVKR